MSNKEKKKPVVKSKINKYDLPGIINQRSHRTLIAGRAGSGKSHLCCKLLKTVWKGSYHEIIFIAPTFAAQLDTLWGQLDPNGISVK